MTRGRSKQATGDHFCSSGGFLIPAVLQASMRSVLAGAVICLPSTVKVTCAILIPLLRLLDQNLLIFAAVVSCGYHPYQSDQKYDRDQYPDEPGKKLAQCPA